MEYNKLLKYTGKNGEYYGQFLERYKASSEFLSWNWTAFFFLPFLLLYRKLWKEFFILMIPSSFMILLAYATSYMSGGGAGSFDEITFVIYMPLLALLSALVMLVIFLRFNALYLQKAEKAIEKEGFQEGEGRSVVALWVYIVFVFIGIGFTTWATLKTLEMQKQQRYSYSSQQEIPNVPPELKKFKSELLDLLHDEKWDESKALIEKQNDLSELSKIDYMFQVIFTLIDTQKVELLTLMIDKKLSIPVISKSSGRDFIKHSYEKKNWKMLKFLMTKGGFNFDPIIWMKKDGYRDDRPMQSVIKEIDIEMLKWIIEKKIPVKSKFYKNKSPLMVAIEAESLEMVKILIEAGANPSYKNLKGDSAIGLSQKSENKEIQSYFGLKVSASTFTISMLNEAIEKKNLNYVKRIIKSGIDANQEAKGQRGKAPLEVALNMGNIEILDYLLENGVDVNRPFGSDYNAVYESVSKNNGLEILRSVLKHGAKVNIPNNKHSALDKAFAPRGDWIDRAKLLVENNVSLTTKINDNGQLALHASLEHPDESLSQMIIDRMVKEGNVKALSVADDGNGDTPLHYAVMYQRTAIVNRLLKEGVDTKAMNNRKVQAISYASTKELLELLESYSDHKPSISDSYCMVNVVEKFDKSKVKHCQTTAEYYESTKDTAEAIWYYFLANDLESVKRYSKDMSWIHNCNCHGYYAYMDIAHAYLLSDDIENAKKYYLLLAEASSLDMYKKWMMKRFKVLEGLHAGYGEKAKKLWTEVWQARYKEDFFETYGLEKK